MTIDVSAGGPALAILEVSHIARGIVVVDAVLKRAEVEMLASRPVSSGKHLVIFRGQVAEVEEGIDAGRRRAGDALEDELYLSMAHEQLFALLAEPVARPWSEEHSVAIVETKTVSSAVRAADAAVKAAPLELVDMRLAVGIAGRAFFTMSGELFDIEAGAEAAKKGARDHLIGLEIIAKPVGDTGRWLVF